MSRHVQDLDNGPGPVLEDLFAYLGLGKLLDESPTSVL